MTSQHHDERDQGDEKDYGTILGGPPLTRAEAFWRMQRLRKRLNQLGDEGRLPRAWAKGLQDDDERARVTRNLSEDGGEVFSAEELEEEWPGHTAQAEEESGSDADETEPVRVPEDAGPGTKTDADVLRDTEPSGGLPRLPDVPAGLDVRITGEIDDHADIGGWPIEAVHVLTTTVYNYMAWPMEYYLHLDAEGATWRLYCSFERAETWGMATVEVATCPRVDGVGQREAALFLVRAALERNRDAYGLTLPCSVTLGAVLTRDETIAIIRGVWPAESDD